MEPWTLSLRQRKLLYIMQNQTSFITSTGLAKQLSVSPRTVRSDISEINEKLTPFNTRIVSEKSKGYFFHSENPDILLEINKMDNAFLTKEERARYLAFALCLSDIPINIYDLEEEMFVSHTTLEHDLNYLREKYVLAPPYISLTQSRDELILGQDERKRRSVLNQLFHEDWNYNTKGNAYYGYQFLDENIMNIISDVVTHYLNLYNLRLEDPNRVMLDLAIAIMYHRVQSGHTVEPVPVFQTDMAVWQATKNIMEALEARLNIHFPEPEGIEIYTKIAGARLMDARQLNFSTIGHYFDYETIHMANEYIELIRQYHHIDLSGDEDFYITLLQYIRYIQTPEHIFNTQENLDIARTQLRIEYELAWLFQDVAAAHLGRLLDASELLYLALCISGALEYLNQNMPETKIKTVVCCHLNLPALWALKRKLLGAFSCYLDVVELLPVNEKDTYDFDGIDLVLATARKKIPVPEGTTVLFISPFLNEQDHRHIEHYITRKRTVRLLAKDVPPLCVLLQKACWHEALTEMGRDELLKLMAKELTAFAPETTDDFLKQLYQRENIASFAYRPGIAFVYAITPGASTRLSIATLKHHILWNGYKVRVVIMAAIAPEEATVLFLLLDRIYQENDLSEIAKGLKTKQDVCSFLLSMKGA